MFRSPDHLLSEEDRGRAGGHQGLTMSRGRRLSLLSWRHWTCFPAADPTCVSTWCFHLSCSTAPAGACSAASMCCRPLTGARSWPPPPPHLLQGPLPPPATFSRSPRPTGSWTLLPVSAPDTLHVRLGKLALQAHSLLLSP